MEVCEVCDGVVWVAGRRCLPHVGKVNILVKMFGGGVVACVRGCLGVLVFWGMVSECGSG